MIGRPEWFTRRKYGGWGLYPKTWQGWAYIAAFMVPFIIFQALPYWDVTTRTAVTVGWLALLMLDTFHIMARLKKDEREYRIEAIAERNAAYAMVGFIIIGILWQLASSSLRQAPEVDWFLIAALFGGLIAKAISNLVLERSAL
ncbi:hypothetical protein JXB02_06630 [Candidatus Woesearchaeota archaeon]|nr:hypothetical protein [Candidatus Woesearchaeota archaeon]